MTKSMEALLERLNAGDDSAAAAIIKECESYLEAVVGRNLSPRLRAKFDPSDVVQSVWMRVLRGVRSRAWRFETVEQLRGFLKKVAYHRFLNRVRHLRRCLAAEESFPEAGDVGPADPTPSPSKRAQADDLWQRMLQLCPPEHRPLLRLRREGLTIEEIAR